MERRELSEQARAFMDSIDSLDEYGFQVRQSLHWLPETREQLIDRLEMNLAIYRESLKNGARFPDSVNTARRNEFIRLDDLKKRAA